MTTVSGAPFPDRYLILFVTFGLIVITLVGQGLLLPSVIHWLGLGQPAADEREREHKAELAARSEALNVAQNRLPSGNTYISCCEMAKSPMRRGAASNASSISRKRA